MAKILTLCIGLLAVIFNINMANTANAARSYYFYEKLPLGVISGSDSDVSFGNAPAGEYTGDVVISVTDPDPLNINLSEVTDIAVTLSSGVVSDWSTVSVEAIVTSGSSYIGAVTLSGSGQNYTLSIGSTESTAGTAIIKLTALLNGVNNSVNNITVSVEDLGFVCNSEDPLSNFNTEGSTYLIENKEQLLCISNYQTAGVLSANYKLTTDITFLGASEDWDIVGSLDAQGWKPLGNSTTKFTGDFDGNGYDITGLYINNTSGGYYYGFFSYLDGSSISNLSLKNVDITGVNYIGGLAGNINASTITNSNITGTVDGGYYIGGFAGSSNNLNISNSYTSVNTTGTANYVGGFVGIQVSGTINNSYASGNTTGGYNVGGLFGQLNNGTINDSFVTANIYGDGSSVGGLVGQFHDNGTINRSYTTGNISNSGGNQYYAGGIAGIASSSSVINESYATGTITNVNHTGGIVGQLKDSSQINNSYSTSNVSGTSCIGSIVGYIWNSSSINNSYATGTVSGSLFAGAIVGYSDTSGGGNTVSMSYNINNTGLNAIAQSPANAVNDYCVVGGSVTCVPTTINSSWSATYWNGLGSDTTPTLKNTGGTQ